MRRTFAALSSATDQFNSLRIGTTSTEKALTRHHHKNQSVQAESADDQPAIERAGSRRSSCGQAPLQQYRVQPLAVLEPDRPQPSRVDEPAVAVQRKGSRGVRSHN